MSETPAPFPGEASRAGQAPVQLFTDLNQQPNLELHTLGANPTPYAIEHPMAEGSINPAEGVTQDIHGVIHAGQELFGVVKASVTDPRKPGHEVVDKYILTVFGNEDQRAEVVGVLEPGYPLTVGRHHQKGLKSSVSREHFRVGLNDDGELVMEDLGSTFGTELATAFTDNQHADSSNVLRDFKRWAPKSSEVKMAALSTRDGLYVEPEQPRIGGQSGLISEVPKDAASAKRLLDAAEDQKQAARDEQLAAREKELSKQLDDLVEGFSEEDKLSLWRYSSGLMNKREAQKRGDGEGSYAYERQAGQGLREMSDKAREIRDEHLRLMQALKQVRGA